MNVAEILATYDAMFGKNSLTEIESYLVQQIAEAEENSEVEVLITLLNEIVGFYRDTTQKEKALKYCAELLELLGEMQLEGSVEYATSLLNIANAYRAFGLFEDALDLFEKVLQIYKEKVDESDFMYASLYNNWSLLYQEMGSYEKAVEMLEKALVIVDSYEDATIPQATTRTNLAASLLQIGTENAYEKAVSYLQKAINIFESDGGRDFHYGAALVAMGDACSYKKEYADAAGYYESGLREIEKHVGKTDNYMRVSEKYDYVRGFVEVKERWKSNLERSREFYEKYGREMICANFPAYEGRIAVGLVGEGSDCYGFDDEISKDHDYAVGFCMWLTADDYKAIGGKLQKEYDKLVSGNNGFLQKRRGVFTISNFYNQLLGTPYDFEREFVLDYEKIAEYQLAAATNGAVFRDDLGIFSRARERLLAYYPEDVWRRRLAQSLHEFSQYAQSNYARMMAREDTITAGVCVGKAVESAMDLVYLLCRKYAPYYKWKRKGLERFPLSEKMIPLLEKIVALPSQISAWEDVQYNSANVNVQDECVLLFEQVAGMILEELKVQGLVTGDNVFLEKYVGQILKGKSMDLVEKIVNLEWKQFDKVKNEGGRADCQDNFGTFSIMRKSQYMAWTDELLESFCNDLLAAESKGWNLITEKYARMMKSTCPDRYAELENDLPVISEERKAIQEEIIKIQVAWMEEFADKYPKMAGNARSIRTSDDTAYNTSYETYLRGEISTYSENTFVLYGRFIVELLQANRNLAYEIMGNTAKLYGYESVEDAESKI